MKFKILLVCCTLLLASCATQSYRSQYRDASTYNKQDSQAFHAIRLELAHCMGHQAGIVIDGSDDVAFLVKHIAAMCKPVVAKLNKTVLAHGFSPAFAEGYVETSVSNEKQLITSLILKEKAKENDT